MQGRIPAPKKHPKKGAGATGAATTNHVLCWEKGQAAGSASLRGQELQEPQSRGAAAARRFDPALKRQKKNKKRKACKLEITVRQPHALCQGLGWHKHALKAGGRLDWFHSRSSQLAGDSQGNPAASRLPQEGFYDHASPSKKARGEIQSRDTVPQEASLPSRWPKIKISGALFSIIFSCREEKLKAFSPLPESSARITTGVSRRGRQHEAQEVQKPQEGLGRGAGTFPPYRTIQTSTNSLRLTWQEGKSSQPPREPERGE